MSSEIPTVPSAWFSPRRNGPRDTSDPLCLALFLAMFARACAHDAVTSDGPMYDHKDDPVYAAAQRWLLAQGALRPQQCLRA